MVALRRLIQLAAMAAAFHHSRSASARSLPDPDVAAARAGDRFRREGSTTTPTCNGEPDGRHTAAVRSVCFNHDGSVLASAGGYYGYDGTIKLWSMSDNTLLKTLEGHAGTVWSVAFNHDGSVLASGSGDGNIMLWSMSDYAVIKTLEGHAGTVYSVAFNHDGSVLASGSGDRTIKLWRETCTEGCSNRGSCSSIAIYGASYTCACD
eukprot:gene28024-23700_t